jgi:processive 1,2-diacylglycerol beta-glucosyltransferase
VDGYFVPTRATQEQLIAAGVPRARIAVTGIPIDPAINLPAVPGVRQALGVSPHVPLVLINGSGIVAARVRAIVRETLALRVPLTLLVAVGRNRALATALAELHSTDWATLHVLGLQPSLDPLIAASDIVVDKPGGLTVSEVLARGVPLLLVTPAPGQEDANARTWNKSTPDNAMRLPQVWHTRSRHCCRTCHGAKRWLPLQNTPVVRQRHTR